MSGPFLYKAGKGSSTGAAKTPRRRVVAKVRLLVLDVDGVLTDGRLHFGADGEVLKVFHVRDGLGIRQLLNAGVAVALISGRNSPMVAARAQELGIEHVFQGIEDKIAIFEQLSAQLAVPPALTACVGDDLPDVPLMRRVGIAFAVRDAHPTARRAAQIITQLPGGLGAVREVCDFLLDVPRPPDKSKQKKTALAGSDRLAAELPPP